MINYPHFGAIGQGGLNFLDGLDVNDSPCAKYYASKDVDQIDQHCKNCLYSTWNDELSCPCDMELGVCDYAKCVSRNYNKNKSCSQGYTALFNEDDINDNKYTPPFTVNDLKGCNLTTTESYGSETIANADTSGGAIANADTSGDSELPHWSIALIVLGSVIIFFVVSGYLITSIK